MLALSDVVVVCLLAGGTTSNWEDRQVNCPVNHHKLGVIVFHNRGFSIIIYNTDSNDCVRHWSSSAQGKTHVSPKVLNF